VSWQISSINDVLYHPENITVKEISLLNQKCHLLFKEKGEEFVTKGSKRRRRRLFLLSNIKKNDQYKHIFENEVPS
jgi:hypothetical protein